MAIRGKIFVALLLAIALVALTPAFAAEKQSMGDAWWTGPLQTPNAGTIPKNHWYVETYFVAEQDNGSYGNGGTHYGANSVKGCATGIQCGYDNAYQMETLMTYGVTNKFNVQILTDFGGQQGGSNSVAPAGTVVNGVPYSGVANGNTLQGVNDFLTRIRLPYKLHGYKQGQMWPTFSIVPEVNIPTGRNDHTLWTPGVGFWAIRPFWMPNGRILRIRASEDVWFPKSKNISVNDFAECTVSNPHATTCNYEKGTYAKTQIGFEYSLTKKWVPAWDFVIGNYGGQQKFNGTKAMGVTGVTCVGNVCNTATGTLNTPMSFAIDPALEYNFTGNTGIIFGVEITVAGTNNTSYIAPQIALQWFK
jgi:hypothetical protein